jgi:hypothetical protein
MSRTNGKRHFNVLRPSTPGHVDFAFQVEVRFKIVCELYTRHHQSVLVPPKDLDKDLLKWRQMIVRHKNGDFRHTDAEYESTKAIAQWTLDVNCDLRGQPRIQMDWKD